MTDLITLAEYKTLKGLTSTNDDAKLTPLIASVSKLVKTYCGTSFLDYYTTALVEYFNVDYGAEFVQLTESPVVEIVSVQERPGFSESYVTLTSADYYLDTSLDTLFRMSGNSSIYFARGPGAVKVTYKAGYATCPVDLKLAVADLITYYLKEEHKTQRSIASTQMQNQGSSSQPKSADFPDHIKRVLDLYRLY
jgi:hypothetical protein